VAERRPRLVHRNLQLVRKLNKADQRARRIQMPIGFQGPRTNECADPPFTAPVCSETLTAEESVTLVKTCTDGHAYGVGRRLRSDRPLRVSR
jgi:hypothetical protein